MRKSFSENNELKYYSKLQIYQEIHLRGVMPKKSKQGVSRKIVMSLAAWYLKKTFEKGQAIEIPFLRIKIQPK